MDYRYHRKRSAIIKFYFKREMDGKKYVWRKKVHRNTNLSKFEKLPFDILTYLTHFLHIINIIILPKLSHSLHDDFKLNYLNTPHAELYLRFNYGNSILKSSFLFSKMDYKKDNSLLEKCLTDNKLLNEFIITISQVIKYLIKEEKFTKDKIIMFIKFMLELNNKTLSKNEKKLITARLISIIVKLTPFLEKHLRFFSTFFHKCLEFLHGGGEEKEIGINGLINLIQNSESCIILENELFREITVHIAELYDFLPSKELEFVTKFHLKIKKRQENDNCLCHKRNTRFYESLSYFFDYLFEPWTDFKT
jgi:hypothetical protein